MENFYYTDFANEQDESLFIVNAHGYTKQETLELFLAEYSKLFEEKNCGYRKPDIDDVFQLRCAFRRQSEDYMLVGDVEQGFPVWAISLESLEKEDTPCKN